MGLKSFMIFKSGIIVFSAAFLFLSHAAYAEEDSPAGSDQQIGDFSLAGYGEKGKKSWDMSGKSADIFENTIKLKDLVGNLYGEKENIKLTADKGDFDKVNGKIHVEQNVVITTSSGAKLTTDSLDWDRVNEVISTKDRVNIHKETMFTTARGALGRPSLNQMNLEKDVTVEISSQDPQDKTKTVITCDGPLQIDYEKNVAIFNNNVKINRPDSQIYSDTMDVYFGANTDKEKKEKKKEKESENFMLMNSSIDKIIAKGNVKTVRGENITYSNEAIYNSIDKKVILLGRPRLVIYSTKDFQGLASE